MSSFRRRPAEASDATAVTELVRALDVAFLGASEYTQAELEEEWEDAEPWVVHAGAELVGYGTVELRGDAGRSDGYVHPRHTGRGVGRYLVDELEAELRARGAARVQNATLLVDGGAHSLLRARGYDEVRRFSQMRIDLEGAPAPPVWPDGVAVSGFDVHDAREFHAAYEAAFADHWGHHRTPFAKWRRANVERPDFSPHLWTVVRAGDRIVAGTICLPERNGVAWVSRLFTVQDWRRRGLGEALLHDAFGKFWRDGRRAVGLGVDAESTTGANRLYERAGMHVSFGAVVFEKELR
ncbi:MAG TPA: GNAT family N-acetyltransferase [Gaiellaceae bacterium]|nr:GNAT family N-acetyltransferase [Gaiellaceae bacterium]